MAERLDDARHAQEMAYKRGLEDAEAAAYKRGWEDAREKAVEIAKEKHLYGSCAGKIRALQPEKEG